jgi:hypothetical protein
MILSNLFVLLLLLIGVNSFSTIPSRIYTTQCKKMYNELVKKTDENTKKNKECNANANATANKLNKINTNFTPLCTFSAHSASSLPLLTALEGSVLNVQRCNNQISNKILDRLSKQHYMGK